MKCTVDVSGYLFNAPPAVAFLHHLSITALTQSGEAGGLGLICFYLFVFKEEDEEGFNVHNYARDAVKYFRSGRERSPDNLGKRFSWFELDPFVQCEKINNEFIQEKEKNLM